LLKRAGAVLLVVGLVDVALMVYAIATSVSYSSSFNLFAVIAGILLLRGSLRTASAVRQVCLFLVGVFISIAVLAPVVLPLGLLVVQVQTDPLALVGSLALFVCVLVMLLWLIRLLDAEAVQEARAAAARPRRDPRIPFGVGVAFAAVLAATSVFVQRSDSAARAINEARANLGDDYSFHVTSLGRHSGPEGTSVAGVVMAWKSGSIREHRFEWRE
jgi:hypothetical protein